MTHGERQPLLRRTAPDEAAQGARPAPPTRLEAVHERVREWLPSLSLLVLPHLVGLMQAVQVPAEVDAIRAISCAHYYAHHKLHQVQEGLDTQSCLAPAVEQHFSRIATQVTFSVVLANFLGMLLFGRLFQSSHRRGMAVVGFAGCAMARVPFLLLPLYQFPALTPSDVRWMSADAILYIYWGCAVLSGMMGAAELVNLMVETQITDSSSPEKRSSLFRQIQIANALGASIGPMLGSCASWLFPHLENRCVGYHGCRPSYHDAPLFNNAPYWLSFVLAWVGIAWSVCVLDFGVVADNASQGCTHHDDSHAGHQSSGPPTRLLRWLGPFSRLQPLKISRWAYDARIAQFTTAEMLFALTNEGMPVLILVMGYVFHWRRDTLSLGLTASNTLRLLSMAAVVPMLINAMARVLAKPESIAHLTREQIDMCLKISHDDVRRPQRCCDANHARDKSHVLQNVSTEQRLVTRLWRAQVDLGVSRLSFLYVAPLTQLERRGLADRRLGRFNEECRHRTGRRHACGAGQRRAATLAQCRLHDLRQHCRPK